jgi:hypothetical protein
VTTDISDERIASIIGITRMYIVFLRSVLRLLVTANVHSSPNLVTLTMEATGFSETSVLARATLRNVPGDGIILLLLILEGVHFESLPRIVPVT